MELRPQDVVLLLKLIASKTEAWSFAKLGGELDMSASHAFASALRAEKARLLKISKAPPAPPKVRGVLLSPLSSNLKEFLIHGVQYAFPVEHGGLTRGIPTADGASPLREHFPESSELLPVWPHADGTVRGMAFSPLYKNVPTAARKDSSLYELLVLVDAIRDGRARGREFAVRELAARI